jgi:hypothetical protein
MSNDRVEDVDVRPMGVVEIGGRKGRRVSRRHRDKQEESKREMDYSATVPARA